MPGTMKMFCIRMKILSHRNNIVLFLACNMAAVQNLYCFLRKDYVTTFLDMVMYYWYKTSRISFQFSQPSGQLHVCLPNVQLNVYF